MSTAALLHLLDNHSAFDGHEVAMTKRLRRFLENLNGASPFARDLVGIGDDIGHVTGSAWIVNEDATKTVLVHHAKLGKWVQPGGHCDGECDVLAVAVREAREETGLKVMAVDSSIFDVDVHLIPPYGNTPAHLHFDVRFLLQADDRSTPVVSHESRDVRWVSLDEAAQLSAEDSITRMISKTRKRFGG